MNFIIKREGKYKPICVSCLVNMSMDRKRVKRIGFTYENCAICGKESGKERNQNKAPISTIRYVAIDQIADLLWKRAKSLRDEARSLRLQRKQGVSPITEDDTEHFNLEMAKELERIVFCIQTNSLIDIHIIQNGG